MRERLAKTFAGQLTGDELIESARMLMEALAEEAKKSENRREIHARQAARLLCGEQRITLIGRWDGPSDDHFLLSALIGYYRTQLPFCVTDVAYSPSLPKSVISATYCDNPAPTFAGKPEQTYPTLYAGFLEDTPGNRQTLDRMLALGGIPPQLRSFGACAPIAVLASEGLLVDGARVLVDTLQKLEQGEAEDRTLN